MNKCPTALCNGTLLIHTFSNVYESFGRAKSKHTFLKLNPNHMYPLLKAKYPPPALHPALCPHLCSAVLSCCALLCLGHLSPLSADPENRAKKEQELEKNMKRLDLESWILNRIFHVESWKSPVRTPLWTYAITIHNARTTYALIHDRTYQIQNYHTHSLLLTPYSQRVDGKQWVAPGKRLKIVEECWTRWTFWWAPYALHRPIIALSSGCSRWRKVNRRINVVTPSYGL